MLLAPAIKAEHAILKCHFNRSVYFKIWQCSLIFGYPHSCRPNERGIQIARDSIQRSGETGGESMKLLLVIALTMLTIWGVAASQFLQVGSSLPLLGAISTGMQETGLTAAPGKLLAASKDLGTVVKTHQLGGWHLAAIVLAVLIARKLLVWLLR
jgi:hypothetical protein